MPTLPAHSPAGRDTRGHPTPDLDLRSQVSVDRDGTAEGHLLDGAVSFMSARTHATPAFGNPAHWAAAGAVAAPGVAGAAIWPCVCR